jgi:hypothetical protein
MILRGVSHVCLMRHIVFVMLHKKDVYSPRLRYRLKGRMTVIPQQSDKKIATNPHGEDLFTISLFSNFRAEDERCIQKHNETESRLTDFTKFCFITTYKRMSDSPWQALIAESCSH